MVCKKCGRSFNDKSITCPFCGVGQENQINIRKLENELEKLKIEEKTSSFYDVQNNKPILDIEDIIDDLENLKIKDKEENNEPVPRVEPVSDEEIIELISDIKENKDLFITDRSQYQYIPKKVYEEIEVIDIEEENSKNIGLNDLINKQRLYNPETPKIEQHEEIELPEVLNIYPEKQERKLFNINHDKQKNYKKEIIICSIVLIIVASIIIFFVYNFMFSPKVKLLKNLSSNYEEIQNVINKYTGNFSELLKHNDISLNSGATIVTVENDRSSKAILNIKYIENKKEKSQYYEYTNLNNYKSQYNKMFIYDNKLYTNKNNQTNELYSTDARFISILNSDSKENIEYLFNMLLDSINSNLSNNNFKIKTVEKQKEITLNIDEKLYSKIYSTYINDIKKDDKALEIIKNTFQYSNVELMTVLNEKLKEIETNSSDKIVITYKFYLNEDNVVTKHYLNYYNYNITILNSLKEKELRIDKNEKEILYLNFKNVNKENNRYNITLEYDNYTLKGDFFEENNKIILNYQKNYDSSNQKNEIVNLVLTKGQKEDKKYVNNISIAYQKTEDNKVISKNIDNYNIIEVDVKISEQDISSKNNTKMMDDNLRTELKEKFSMFIK